MLYNISEFKLYSNTTNVNIKHPGYGYLGGDFLKRVNEIEEKNYRLEASLLDSYDNPIGAGRISQLIIDYLITSNYGEIISHAFNAEGVGSFNEDDNVNFIRSKVHFHFGVILDDLFDQHDLARDEYKKAIILNDTYAAPYYRLSLLNNRIYKLDSDQDYNNMVARITDVGDEIKAEIYGNLGSLFSNDYKDYTGSKKAFELQVKYDGENAFAFYNLGVILRDKFHRKQDAKKLIDKAIELDGNILKEAQMIYERRIDDDSPDVSEFYELGVLLRDYLNDLDRGNELIKKALEVDPGYLDIN